MSEKPEKSVQFVVIDDKHAGQRLDNFLLAVRRGVPKSLIYRVIRKGEVRVNKKRCKPLDKLVLGDEVRIPPMDFAAPGVAAAPSKQLSDNLRNRVLWDDDAMLVLDKPSGLAVHGGSGIQLGMIESLRQIFPEYRFLELVHRLDRDTSGCVMVAKKRSALKVLHEMLRQRQLDKGYLCLVHGAWPDAVRKVDAPLTKQVLQSGERLVKVDHEHGKASDTRFRVVQRFGQTATLMAAFPKTGRTHQIRVHALAQGHVIMGDDKYADQDQLSEARQHGVRRLFLHAASLRLPHPFTQEEIKIEAPMPDAFRTVMNNLAESALERTGD